MKHLITARPTTLKQQQATRLARDTQKYLTTGGTITHIPAGAQGDSRPRKGIADLRTSHDIRGAKRAVTASSRASRLGRRKYIEPFEKLILSIAKTNGFTQKEVRLIRKKLRRIRARKEANYNNSPYLLEAFFWEATEEGREFWAEIDNRLLAASHKHETQKGA